MSRKKLDKLVSKMYNALQHGLDTACPKTLYTQGIGDTRWATENNERGKRKVNEYYKKAKITKLPDDWTSHRKADKDFKKVCKTDRNKGWRNPDGEGNREACQDCAGGRKEGYQCVNQG